MVSILRVSKYSNNTGCPQRPTLLLTFERVKIHNLASKTNAHAEQLGSVSLYDEYKFN